MDIRLNKYLKYFLIFVLFLLFGGIMSCSMRLWPDFDFSSYHFYNGWAFLHDRIASDFMAASFRTYFNPVLDSLTYITMRLLNNHPLLFLFVTGFKYGIFMFLCYCFFDLVFKKFDNKHFAIAFCMLLAFLSPIALLTIGFDWVDLQVASLNLLAIGLFIYFIFKPASKQRLIMLFLSGLVLGIAMGLKYYVCVFGISFLLCVLIKRKDIEQQWKVVLLLISGMFLGLMITGGYWMLELYKHFANPLFPYLNNIFHSPMGSSSPVMDYDFSHIRPKTFWGLLFLPLGNTIIENVSLEYSFYDLKLPLTFILVVSYFILKLFRLPFREKTENIIDPKIFDVCLILLISSYYICTYAFALVRYLLVLIPFACVVITVFAYFTASYIKKINLYFVVTFAVIALISHLFFALFWGFKVIAFLIFALAFGLLLYVTISDKFSEFNKSFYSVLLIIVLCFVATTRCVERNSTETYNLGQVMNIEKTDIKDDSVVLCGTMTSCFVAPGQNKKAKYISFALQKKYQDERNELEAARFATLTEYRSDYMENLMKEIFEKEKDIYIIFAHNDMSDNFDTIRSIYQKSVSEYMNSDKNIYENCRFIDYFVFTYDKIYGKYEICKVK